MSGMRKLFGKAKDAIRPDKSKKKKAAEQKKASPPTAAAKEQTKQPPKLETLADLANLLKDTEVSKLDELIGLNIKVFKKLTARHLVYLLDQLQKTKRMDFVKILAKHNILDTILLNISDDDKLKTELQKNDARTRRHLRGARVHLPLVTDSLTNAFEFQRGAKSPAEARRRAIDAKTLDDIFLDILYGVAGHERLSFTESLSENQPGQKNIIEFIQLIKKETFFTYVEDIDDYIQLNTSFSLETRKELLDATLLKSLRPLISSVGELDDFLSNKLNGLEELQLHFVKKVDLKALLSIIPEGQYQSAFSAIFNGSTKLMKEFTKRQDYQTIISPLILIDNLKNTIDEYQRKLIYRKDSPAKKAKATALNSLMKTLQMNEEDKLDSKKLAEALTQFENEYNKPATKKAFHDPGILKFLRAIANILSAKRHERELTPHKKIFKHQVKGQLAKSHALFGQSDKATTASKKPTKKNKCR